MSAKNVGLNDSGSLNNTGEDWFGEEGPSPEDLFFDDDEDAGFNASALQRMPAESPEVIERLGSLMAVLGPRYKTLSRDALWERARIGETTPLQRQLSRVGEAKEAMAGSKNLKGAARRAKMQQEPKEAPDEDPDRGPRAAWLEARAREKERRDRAHQKALGFLQLPVKV